MTLAEFKSVVAAGGGEERVIGIVFDNGISYTYVTPGKEFSYARCLDESCECIKEMEIDGRANAFWIYKHIENIQAVLFAADKVTGEPIDVHSYDRTSLRCV